MDRSPIPYFLDILEAADRIAQSIADISFETFRTDWRRRWIVERGIEIVSEASRRLPPEFKDRHPEIPWRNVAGVGNVLRHNYEKIDDDVIWTLIQSHLPELADICRIELDGRTEV